MGEPVAPWNVFNLGRTDLDDKVGLTLNDLVVQAAKEFPTMIGPGRRSSVVVKTKGINWFSKLNIKRKQALFGDLLGDSDDDDFPDSDDSEEAAPPPPGAEGAGAAHRR